MRKRTSPLRRSLQAILRETDSTAGKSYFRALTRGLTQELGVRAAFISLHEEKTNSIQTLAVARDGMIQPNYEFTARGTPWQAALTPDTGAVFHESDCHERYRGFKDRCPFALSEFLTVPLYDARKSRNFPIGHLGILHDSRLSYSEMAETLLQVFAARTEAEVARIQLENHLSTCNLELSRFKTAIDQIPESVLFTDTRGTILYVNPAFENDTGYSRAEALATDPGILKSDLHTPEFYRDIWRTIRKGDAWSGTLFNRRKDDTLLEQDVTISPVRDQSGQIVNYVAVSRDISDKRRRERALFRLRKAESVGRLAGGIAHKFNNLLTGILGNASLALLDVPENSSLRVSLDEIIDSSRIAADLSGKMLAYSGKKPFSKMSIDPKNLFEHTNKLIQTTLASNISLEWVLPEDLSPMKGDVNELQQILLGIVNNAVEAIGHGKGSIKITFRNIELNDEEHKFKLRPNALKSGSYVQIEIKDNGCGMDSRRMEKIFDPFYSTKAMGRGLGLASAQGIVRAHLGSISVTSALGEGTAFSILLPAVRAQAASENSGARPAAGHRRTILVIDDERIILNMAERALTKAGWNVLTAPDGRSGVEIFRKFRRQIAATLLDFTMPGLNGSETLACLRAVDPFARVIFTSGYAASMNPNQDGGPNADAYIPKPYTAQELIDTVQLTVARRAKKLAAC
ncbi:MAG: hypothetical protein COB53_09240 [Elusimicrobia bacterium]|nr:MAG: hypothetical protein COB53_09240 [Elusimicrobiota bacterium]